jgi:hypothetical protein
MSKWKWSRWAVLKSGDRVVPNIWHAPSRTSRRLAGPAAHQSDAAPAGQAEGGDVIGVAGRMLAHPVASGDAAAVGGAEMLEADDALAEVALRGRGDKIALPQDQPGGDGAGRIGLVGAQPHRGWVEPGAVIAKGVSTSAVSLSLVAQPMGWARLNGA